MRIVVLDGYTLNPGDLSWYGLQALGQCAVHDRTPPERVVERCRDADAVLTNKVLLDAGVINSLPFLRYIGVLATGYNVVDLDAARVRNITVTNVPAYSTRSVTQLVFALLLELAHHAGDHSRAVRAGKWARSRDFTFWDWPLVELDGLTMGIVGYGNIGRGVARVAEAFGMEVLVFTRNPDRGNYPEVRFAELEVLFAESDVVTLHCPLTPETEGLVNAERLALMGEKAFLINTSRGPVVDESALADALNDGRIAGAAVDVLSQEPPHPTNPLLGARNCIVTPHIGWATGAARARLMDTVTENLRAWIEGRPENVVNE
ncbi:MAG: D-2-hydroxyacid dehydrogenase [bacterium]|nr:MAG: D-2-hydroxyacid dehydrogenase [bacterium]